MFCMNREEYEKLKAQSGSRMTRDEYENAKTNTHTNTNEQVKLQLQDGKEFGMISYNAYHAISNGLLDYYNPVDDNEKKVLDSYKSYISSLAPNNTTTNNTTTNGRDATFKDLTINSFKRGYVQSLYGQESYKEMTGQKNNKAYYEEKLKSEDYSFIPDGWFEKMVSGGMELFGQQVKQWTDPRSVTLATTAAGTAAIAGQMGPQVLAPEEVFTVPGAFIAGMTTGSITANFEIEAGHAYNEMVENGISPETAKKIALGVGAGNAILEAVQIDDLLKSFKILNRTNADNVVTKKLLSYLKERGVNVAKETAQEVAQEIVTLAGVDIARGIDGKEPIYTGGEVVNRLVDTAASSALSFAFMGTGGDAIKYGANKTANAIDDTRKYTNIGKFVRETDAVQSVIDTGMESPKESNAFKLAQKAQLKLTKKHKLSDYDIGKLYYANVEQIKQEEQSVKNAQSKTAENDDTVADNQAEQVVSNEPQTTPKSTETTPIATEQRNVFTDELDDIASTEMPTVSVGDTFVENVTGKIVKVVSRDANATTVEITTADGKTQTRQMKNTTADTLAVNDSYTKAETTAEPSVAKSNVVGAVSNDTKTNAIKFVQNGEFYNAYGADAEFITKNLGLKSTPVEFNGETVSHIGLSPDAFKIVSQELGKIGVTVNTATPVTNETDGNHTVAYTNDNERIELQFKVVSVDDLIASNELDGRVNPNYPQELQPRDRRRTSSQSQIQQMAYNINPARLAESTNVSEGAPIVGADNVVESGNGRTLSIKLAYQLGTADEYRNFIVNNAGKYGIDVSNLPDKPILVRERLTEVDRVAFTRKANESSISSLSATEQAKVDAENLTSGVLDLLIANDDGKINTPDNKDFVSAVITKVFKNEDLNNVVGADNVLSARGLERIRNAIFYKAYGDASLSARLSESLDNDMKNATNVLLNIAPKVVYIKNGIASGQMYNFDFSNDIASAVRLFEECRNRNTTISDYAAQTTMFDKEPQLVMAMAYVFETKNRGAKQATDFYNSLLDGVISLGDPNQISFGIVDTFETKEELFNAVQEQYNAGVDARQQITIPEEIYRSDSIERRDDDGRGIYEVAGSDTARSQENQDAVGVQQDNGPVEETRVVANDAELRQTKESVEGQPEVSKVEKKKKTENKHKVKRAKKADWNAHDVLWYAPNSNTIIAYSTVATSDLIGVMADDNPAMTISELHDAINYDVEAKKVLLAYINSGFGDEIAGKNFSYAKTDTKPSATTTDESSEVETVEPVEATAETEETKETEKVVSKGDASKQIADYVADKLAKGEKLSAMELSQIASKAFGGTMADNAFSIKDAYDAMELGVNQHILSMKDVSADKMLELLELLPTQTKRTEEMVKFQQFSTPPSIAYLANYTANVNANDIMLEPSAGIGGIAVFAKKDGAKVYVNELDTRRLEVLKNMPFDGFFNENAEQLDNILGGEIEPTVIVMNPPFSSSSERNMKNTKIGAKHIEQALKILAPNGRLVAIVGKGMADGEPAFRTWWDDIKSQYNVRANIGINGKNYNKYGTSFDIQMLVIDKNGPTTQPTVTAYVDTLQELQEKLGGIRDERPAIDYSANEQRTPATTRQETVGERRTGNVGNRTVSDAGSTTDNGKSADVSRDKGKSNVQDIQSTDTKRGEIASVKSENTDVVDNEQSLDGRGKRGGHTDLQDNGRADISDSRQHSEQSDVDRSDGKVGTRQNDVRVQRPKRTKLTDSIFEQYQTQPLTVKNAQPHPARVSESAAMSAIEPPAITYKPNLPQDIIDKGVVSAVQLEAISYAGQSHSQTLPNGTTRGFFLGDGTGIGKGRTIAGMMLDNYNQGRKKAVWVTLNPSLVNDAKRDVKALFGDSDLVMQFEGGEKANKIFDKNEAILVVSYTTLSRGYDNKDSNFEKIVNWLGKDFDGIIVFDEAHKMGNATSTKGTRGIKKASQTGLAGIALQEALPSARVVYSSATGATEVENLRYAERLGLWGEGTPFIKGDDFVSKVKAGGLAAMELIARDMKAMGVYLSRNISYDDVQYDKITHNLTAQQTKIYDELASSWQIVLQNINKALEATNQDKDGHARGRALGAFWSSQQRFFNQILTSMQVPSVISDIEQQLADGKSCVIQLVSTNESAQNQEFERLKAEDLDLDEFDLTPKQVLMSLIENSFPVQQFEEYRDDKGNVRSRPVFDSNGKIVVNRDAVRQREELLDKLGSIKVPSSPIDMIINHFGTELVAENTGRQRRVIQKDGKTIEEKIGNKKDADVDAFQNGKKRIIIFSKAGGTGKSYHADKSAKNQQQRVHYLLEAGWQADNAVQGFGRSHRSNQASAPIFKLVTTNLKGQMRFISTIAKRLDQLGAMTKGQRQAGGQGMFSASDNLENSFAADVLAGFYKDLVANRVDGIDDGLAILEKLGLKNKILNEYGQIMPTAPELREVNKFLNRILSLESAEQNTVFEGYSVRLQDATERAMQAGTLDKGLENYKADKITLNEVHDIREDESSGAKTKYYHLTAEHKIKPVRFEDIQTDSKSFVGYYKNKNTGNVRAVMHTSSSTDQYGNVTQNYKLIGQVKPEYIPQHRLYNNWVKITEDEARKAWNEELSNLPEFRKENLHLISGVVLPVWDKLPTENVRIYRVLTSDGEMLIGRVVSEDMIDETLRRLGSFRKKEKIATKDLITSIKNGDKVYLENDWIVFQSRVANEKRIEISGPSYEHLDMLKEKGVFAERIAYRTRYFVPANNNTEQIIDDILKISPVMRVETEKYSVESEDFNNEQTGSLLSDGIGERSYSPSTKRKTKKMDGRSSRYREGRTTARERRKYCQTLKDAGHTKQKIVYGHECEVIPSEHYTPRMTKIAEQNLKDGIDETVFVTGKFTIPFAKDKNGNPKQSKGAYIKVNGKKIVIVQYDNEFYLPEQINDHEKIHDRYQTSLVQKAKNVIINSLTVAEKKKVLEKLARDYNGIIEGNEEAIIEEFVANVLSNMDYEYLGTFVEIQKAYWKGDERFIDNYKVSEYTESIDAGGTNADILDGIGFGNEFRLSENYGSIPYDEYMQLREYIVDKNNRNATLLSTDCKEIGNNFYIWRNASKTDFVDVRSIPLEGNHDVINSVRSDIENGTIRGAKSVSEWSANIRSGKRSSTVLDSGSKRTTPNRIDDRLSVGQSESDTLGHIAESGRTERQQLKSVDNSDAENNIMRYSTSVDDDIAELTPERKKEIFEQFERDRVGVDKPTQRQIWGERAEWIAHNMTRVFPDIPERGEKGTFFAEFRKMMIQWKALPNTSMFMTQDKLNQMTKDLTPDEFKTFSELVYFLDLQEEAQIQKERGYGEILLPNEITPHEVDQIVDVLNKEATDNVRNALEKRRKIWDDLKEQYITLNQYIGFDTDGRFNRKNYYHHQVIEYMNQGGKGVAKGKDIEIKAGRGWLKERQGSTKATNTDFLAVEYKAMLQMQYDIYVANMLGKIKDQYDIKPQLEKQAFNHNKELLQQKIVEEATDENGDIMLDSKGKPDSETYRQQKWYNQRIMFGFSGLFGLAEAGMLPTFNGQYGNVIRALQAQKLNVPGLYNYVGELASMELPDTATDEELQARISARTVLKYTSQKKAWVKEVLGSDYQTWETLAEDMSDTHSIHQPRRGNYFYTKTTVDEDAFNKAFNDMIVGLVAGENGVEITSDMKKLFEQYSETVRLMGAAYEQWVIPNEIETTMNKVANPNEANAVSKLSRAILSAWKGWSTSVNPLRTVKFGIRNIFGDLDAVIAGNPKVVVYSKQAVAEIYQAMKNKKYSPEFMEWVERGGYSSLIFANEMDTEMQDKLFSHLKGKEGVNIFKIPAKLFEGYYNGVEAAHNFREAILRYSAYLYFKNEIAKNGGQVKDNVASNRFIIRGLHSVEDKAYQLSKDLLGAYDEVNVMGQALRRHLIPFYSFTETNLKRYYRLFENIITSDDNIPKKAGKLMLKALMVNALTLLMVAWNQLVMKDEDDELPPTARNVPHITLGKIGDDVYAFRQLGSFSELLEWIGFEDYKWTEEDLNAPIDKAVGMITPVIKTPIELLTGLNFYPSITQPRAIRDKVEHLFSTLGVDDVYRIVAGKPTKGIGDIAKGAVTYSYDYKESAYYEILDIKREYQGDTDNTIYGQTPKSNALYYMKTAIRYKDKEAALKYLDKYFENGGTAKGIAQSMEMLNPMYGYTGKDTIAKGQEFVNSLSDDEKDKLKIAIDYYENDLMLPANVSSMLRKKGITDEQAKNLLTKYINSQCK